MNTAKQREIFISYSRTDKEFALEFAREMKSAGYLVWLDLLDIPTGARWDDEVEKALHKCEIFLIILTVASVSSDNVKDEIGYAIDHDKRIMPVLLENCDVPLRLRRFQYVDFTTVEFEEGIQKAKQLLETLMAQPSTPLVPINPEPKPQKVPKKETTLAPELPNKNKPSQRRWVVSVAGIFLLAICFGVFATIFLLSNVIFPQTNQIQTQTSPVALTSNSSSPTSASPSSSQFALQSIFDNLRTDSWTTDFGKLTNPGAGGSGGGQGNGCLVWSEGVDGIANYYIAPSKYHGNWQVYSELRLDLWSSGGEYFDSEHEIHGDIYIVSGSATAHRLLPYRPPEQWETFVIPLVDDGQWIVGGGTTTLSDVLANVTDFQIRADYGTGDDTTGLDNVVLVPRLQE